MVVATLSIGKCNQPTVKETCLFPRELGDTSIIVLRPQLNNVAFVSWNYLTFDDHKSAKTIVNAKMKNIIGK